MSALRRKWWLALILCPLGAALGATAASIGPTEYTVESRQSIGAGTLPSQAVPGFALASQELADKYARWINNTSADISDKNVKISADPVPETAVFNVTGVSSDKAAATKAVNDAVASLKKKIAEGKPENDPATLLKRFEAAAVASAKMESQVDEANSKYQSAIGGKRSSGTLASLKSRLDDLRSQQALLDVRRDTLSDRYKSVMSDQTTAVDIVTAQEPRVTGNDRVSKLQRYGLIGFVLGGLISLLAATMMGRNNKDAHRGVRKQSATAPARRPAPAAAGRRPARGQPTQGQADANGAPWAQTRTAAPAAGSAPADARRAPVADNRGGSDGKRRQ